MYVIRFPGSDFVPDPLDFTTVVLMEQVFLNIVLEDAIEEKANGEKVRVGQVVRTEHEDRSVSYGLTSSTDYSRQFGGHARSARAYGRFSSTRMR